MTTDTVPKTAVRSVELAGKEVKIAGIAKGAGMIMPNMATMLSFVLTDAVIDPAILKQLLTDAVATSFNAITIDGDTSTNDTVLLLASGKAENALINAPNSPAAQAFGTALRELLTDLAWQIVADGEGATKFVTVTVKGAVNRQQAETAARTIANSPLVKTAFFGEDANWGRIIAALGRSGADCDQERIAIFFDDVRMVQDGLGCGSDVGKSGHRSAAPEPFRGYRRPRPRRGQFLGVHLRFFTRLRQNQCRLPDLRMKKKLLFLFLVLIVIGIGLLHFFTPGNDIFFHDTYRRLSYFPIVMGAIWFGVWGGLSLAILSSIAFIPHLLLYFGHAPQTYLSELTEIILYLAAGVVTGVIAGREAKTPEEI